MEVSGITHMWSQILLFSATASQMLRIRLCVLCAWMSDVEYGLCQRCSYWQLKPSCEMFVLYLGIAQTFRVRIFTFCNLLHQLSILGYINMPAMHWRAAWLLMPINKRQCACRYFVDKWGNSWILNRLGLWLVLCSVMTGCYRGSTMW